MLHKLFIDTPDYFSTLNCNKINREKSGFTLSILGIYCTNNFVSRIPKTCRAQMTDGLQINRIGCFITLLFEICFFLLQKNTVLVSMFDLNELMNIIHGVK